MKARICRRCHRKAMVVKGVCKSCDAVTRQFKRNVMRQESRRMVMTASVRGLLVAG